MEIFFKQIREILYNDDLGEKERIDELQKLFALTEGLQVKYTDTPRLENKDDIYYSGCGTTWGTDLDGNRYWKKFSPFITKNSNYNHLNYGDIINEKARTKKIVMECLSELKIH